MEGGIEHLRDVVVNDSLNLGAQLEQEMQKLIDTYTCEWAEVVRNPAKRAKFRHFANSRDRDSSIRLLTERGQHRPVDWDRRPAPPTTNLRRLPVIQSAWVRVGSTRDFPRDGGVAVKYGEVQIAVFNFASRGEWYATQNMCPHRKDMVLARGIVGDQAGSPKVACPMHKKTFALDSGACLSGDPYRIATFPVRVDGEDVYVELPPADELAQTLCRDDSGCAEAIAS
jgi:NAD(P)H-dependent nitrite reductase small subunit